MDDVTPRDKVQFGIAIGLMIFGCVVLLIGLLTPPEGQIHNSVLVAFGEIATLAAGVLGIDAIYTNKLQKIVAELKKDNPKEQDNG
jgi:ABC-type transport system involved in cytochrome c biogenesis permease component